MFKFGRAATLTAIVLAMAACSSAAPAATVVPTPAPTPRPTPVAALGTPVAGGLLDKVLKDGKLVVSSDPNGRPRSEQQPDGSFQGFDPDVAAEIARRLGVRVGFVTPKADAVAAGNWKGGWDISVRSMTITADRQKALDFSAPYYYTAAGEPMGIAADKRGPNDADFMVRLDAIVRAMHDDGTLSALSTKWFKADLTKPASQ